MKDITLKTTHEALGAKLVPYAGFNMPVQYEGVSAEHETVRHGIGVFDVSHMGEFLIEGPHALELIQKVCSNDASKLAIGKAQYSYLPNEDGGIVDDLIIYKLEEDSYLLELEVDENDMVKGPKAVQAIQSLTSHNLTDLKFYNFVVGDFAGVDNVIISATGYTGSGGFEIYCKNTEVKQIWDKVFEAGAAYGIKPIGLAARDTLRLEMGYCLYGNDIDDTISPIAAGLGWVTKFTKDFTNSEALKAEKENGPKTKLIGFELDGKGIPRQGYDIVDDQGIAIGIVTSGTMSPSLHKGIGLGYVPTSLSEVGNKIYIQIRKNAVPATIVKTPFYRA